MKLKSETVSWAVFILIALAGLGGWGYETISKHRIEKAEEQQRAERHAQTSVRIAALVSHYNAITDWTEKISNANGKSFSLEMEDAIVNTQGKPILISHSVNNDGDNSFPEVSIDDVIQHGDKFFIHVSVSKEPTVRFVLECDSAMARHITKSASDFSDYAIIARIVSVEKAALKLSPGSETEQDDDEHAYSVEVVSVDSSDLFFARGRCIDLLTTDDERPLPARKN